MIFENAHEILKKLKQKEVSAQEVLESFLKQVEAVNPSINAVVALDAERALEKAKKADKKTASKSKLGSLHGLPMTIKDAFEVEGIVSTGAILLGKTIFQKEMQRQFKDWLMQEQSFLVKPMCLFYLQIYKALIKFMALQIILGIWKELLVDLRRFCSSFGCRHDAFGTWF